MWKSSLCHRLNFPVLAVKLTELARRQEFLTKNTEVLAFAIQMKKEEISKYFTTGRRMSVNYSRAALKALSSGDSSLLSSISVADFSKKEGKTSKSSSWIQLFLQIKLK